MHKEPIKSEESCMRGRVSHSHPSFGMISVSRASSNRAVALFGSEVKSSSLINIRVEQASVVQDLGRNWYHGETDIVEVTMSPVQYAEMISCPNTSGVPCTITRTESKGSIEYAPIDTVTEYVESKLNSDISKLKKNSEVALSKVVAILKQKGTLKAADKAEIMTIVGNLTNTISDSIPFYEKNIRESIVRTKMEAKAEIDSYVTHSIYKAGIDNINNSETLKLLIGNKTNENDL